jgi:hypothetical protein
MSKRREFLRAAGWMAVIGGLAGLAIAVVSDQQWADLAGAYGLLFVLSGAWTVGGVSVLNRHERRAARVRAAARIVTDPREPISR